MIPTPISLTDISRAEKRIKRPHMIALLIRLLGAVYGILDLTAYSDIGVGCRLVSAGMYACK